MLYERGASLTATDYDGHTPIHVAIAEGHLEVTKWLRAAKDEEHRQGHDDR